MHIFNKKEGSSEKRRINFIFTLTLVLSGILMSRLFYLQVIHHDSFKEQAGEQREFSSVIPADRGKVFLTDKFGQYSPLATNLSEYEVYAVPKDIQDKDDFTNKVSEILGVDHDTLLLRVSKEGDPYEPIKSGVSEENKAKLDALGLKGIGYKEHKGRAYPNNDLASHISGFLSLKTTPSVGQYGIEEYYNSDLSGKDGYIAGQKDSKNSSIIDKSDKSYPAINGDYIFLSIDPNVQFKIEDELEKVVNQYKAESGSVIVMEPNTGRILGMANYPDFDPNMYSQVDDISVFKNKAVSSQYEPGSIFKPITMASAIDLGLITPSTKYEDKGFVSMAGYTIKNYDGKVHGENTMTQVLEKSLNTGTVFVEQKMDKEDFLEYIKKFGFGDKTRIDLPVEAPGDIRNLEARRDINFATASFGQGIAVTSIQMISAIAALANDGVLVKPKVVDKIFQANGSTKYLKKEDVRQVVSESTAKKLQQMMVSVVENGFDKAKIPGYFVAGKTGTAQIPSDDGKGYSQDQTIQSFVGFAPAYKARFVVLIKMDKPQGVNFASVSLTGPFKEIMAYLLNYYEVPPDFKE